MSTTWGSKLKFTIFGESHGTAIGGVIDGLPSGFKLNHEALAYQMRRRAPGLNSISSTRQESDQTEILSGYFNDKTTGTPLAFMIKNKDQQSDDYDKIKHLMRPGHADYSGWMKYGGHNDYRGGGHFSGRLTAPIVYAGSIAKQVLSQMQINVVSHIKSIGSVIEESFDMISPDIERYKVIETKEFPVINEISGFKMVEEILNAKNEHDSVGGVIECMIAGISPGLGEPFFDSIESRLSHFLFSIPAVKGVEFGTGFDITKMRGSESNDGLYLQGDGISHVTNNNGGVVGGLSNGMPIVFRVAIKPTPTIAKSQMSIDIKNKNNVEINAKGRHDPCIVPRALPVIEAVAAFVMLDIIMEGGSLNGLKTS